MRPHRRPSPALVVACLALAVSLGGTGYAAVVLPANSVGTKQLQNGAVVGAKVKPHSLVASNFAPGSVPAGPPGAQGLPGPAGPKGDSATKLFANVKPGNSSSGLVYGPSSGTSGNPGRSSNGVGLYTVTFNQDVSHCAVLAIPGGNNLEQGTATAKPSGGNTVTVQTYDSGGSPTALDDFTLAVFC
ncbi:MAG TPA: hypothetical protein VMB53_10125 [Gaiellaceae bacterium]|nr:hypothetical protein [Gaiellaceae bacterium]